MSDQKLDVGVVSIDGITGSLSLGKGGIHEGDLFIYSKKSNALASISLNGNNGSLTLRDENKSHLRLLPMGMIVQNDNKTLISLLGVDTATLSLLGAIKLTNAAGKEQVFINPAGSDLWMGGNGDSGDILLYSSKATATRDPKQASIWLKGEAGDMVLKGAAILQNKAGKEQIFIDPNGSDLWMGGNGDSGDILLFPSNATSNRDGSQATIWIKGEEGDIILANADCAEEFDIADTITDVEPGTVMVLDEVGKLCPSYQPFDKCVVGVVSGAGDYKPGIILDRQKSDKLRLPLALMGKVFCKVDASLGAIKVGDLMTSSPTPGHAMRTDDPLKAFGAVLGKALRPLASGQGLIPILVALQ